VDGNPEDQAENANPGNLVDETAGAGRQEENADDGEKGEIGGRRANEAGNLAANCG